MEEQLLNLLQKVRDEADEAARTELNELLRNVPEARTIMARTLVDEQALVGHLRDESIVSILDAEGEVAKSGPPARPATRLWTWPQQIAIALVAGAFVGLLGVGVVRAVNSPQSQARALHVANGDFEAFSGPVEIGFPSQFGRWGGNPAEVIEDPDGNRVLRFLKTGNVNGDPDDFASNCSVFQLIDLSSLRQQWEATVPEMQVTLNLSARFRRKPAPTDAELPKLVGSCRIYLFEAEPEAISQGWPRIVSEDGVGYGKKVIELAPGEEPATITASCLLDSDATVALIVVAAGTRSHAAPIELGGYFVDDVKLTAIRQPTLPVHFVK
ncbi:hypothetical protein [Rubinisphaera margarita]|uniref:hypothetical protein n=1 Tax=Rubinisphaera margarita TaxID=2909586 RepID=UPI001EE88ACF|nr:hypothetical protein [Rubinisphaera margarita]MCG6155866.1 hypothetical protein [Rubinisphaera margarita]